MLLSFSLFSLFGLLVFYWVNGGFVLLVLIFILSFLGSKNFYFFLFYFNFYYLGLLGDYFGLGSSYFGELLYYYYWCSCSSFSLIISFMSETNIFYFYMSEPNFYISEINNKLFISLLPSSTFYEFIK